MNNPTIHASAVLVGARALLIRGPSGAGKSRLVWDLLRMGRSGALPFVRLVGDDRVHLTAAHGRLLVQPAATLAGRLEVRGAGILQIPHEPIAIVGWIVDLADPGATRLPAPTAMKTEVLGLALPRLGVAADGEPVPMVLAFLTGTLDCDP